MKKKEKQQIQTNVDLRTNLVYLWNLLFMAINFMHSMHVKYVLNIDTELLFVFSFGDKNFNAVLV